MLATWRGGLKTKLLEWEARKAWHVSGEVALLYLLKVVVLSLKSKSVF